MRCIERVYIILAQNRFALMLLAHKYAIIENTSWHTMAIHRVVLNEGPKTGSSTDGPLKVFEGEVVSFEAIKNNSTRSGVY